MKRATHQRELPLTNEAAAKEAMPEEVIAECRQLIAQILGEVLRAEKEVGDEE